MVNYRYIGKGVTDSNGVAHMTEDAEGETVTGYVGEGKGLTQIVASTDKPADIGDSSLQSRTFSVFDCYKKDTGMSDYSNIWSIANANLSRDGNYSTITESTTGTTGVIGISNVSLINYRIEVDVYQVDGTGDEWALQVMTSDYQEITSANAKLGEWKHISLDITDAPINTRVRLATGNTCTKLRFKNFMIYQNGDNDVISINASNPVIVSTETTNITGSLFINGELQKNTNIDVYKNGTKVDTISTGSNGVASYTYTGSGAGATEFQFKYGIILSEIFVTYDCIFADDGIINPNNKWDMVFVTRSLESNGTKFLVTQSSAMARASMNPIDNASAYDFDAQPMVFECYLADFYVPSNAIGMQFIQTGSNPNKQMNFSTQDIGHTIKVVYDGTSLIKYRDDVEVSRTSVTYTDKIRVGFTFNTVDGYIVVRDVKVYPI